MRTFPAAAAIALMTFATAAQEPSSAAVDTWLSAYEAAWETRDAEAVARLFTPDATYFETPWSEPFEGSEGIAQYWAQVTADQRNVDFEFDIIAINGSTAVARWNARFEITSSGAELGLDGVFILEFTDRGTVSELREWWVLEPAP